MQELGGAPRAGVSLFLRVPVVENLPHAARNVAVRLEVLRERNHVRPQLAEVSPVVPKPERVRA